MELTEYRFTSANYRNRWYYVYLRGEAITIINDTMFCINKPRPSQPGCYLAKLKGLPVIIVLLPKPTFEGTEGYAVLLRDQQTLSQVLQIKEQQG